MTSSSPDAAPPEARGGIPSHIWPIAIVVILGMIMSVLDTTIVNVALQDLSIELDASLDQIQWVVTGYMLALAAVIPITGWAATRYSARKLYITSFDPLHARLAVVRSRVVVRLADPLPRPAGRRRRHARADRPDDPRQGRRPEKPAADHVRDRRPDHPRARLRPDARRPADRARRLGVDLLHQPAGRHRRGRRRASSCCRRTAATRPPADSTRSASCSSRPVSSASPTASRRAARPARSSPRACWSRSPSASC